MNPSCGNAPKTRRRAAACAVRLGSYARLSRDDDTDGPSNSIVNQQQIIRQYCESSPENLVVVREYADDGYSGTTFDRPGWRSLMRDLEDGILDGFVVKDSSRFSRNFVEGGMMLQKMFPKMNDGAGVRVIMVNDAYDSASSDPYTSSVMMAFRGLFNDNVSRDTSLKTRTGLHAKMRRGEFCCAWAPYGYRKGSTSPARLEPDPETAPVVRRIFAELLGGSSPEGIARALNAAGVPCPIERRRESGEALRTGFAGPAPRWHAEAVARILKNEVYAGVLVQGRTYTPSHRSRRTCPRPPSEQFRAEGAHEAIVDAHSFELAQSILSRDTRTAPGAQSVSLFAGLAFCADCGQQMVLRSGRNGNRYLVCSTNKRDPRRCSSHMVNLSSVKTAVFDAAGGLVRDSVDLAAFVKENRELVISRRTSEIDRLIDDARKRQERALSFRHGLVDDLEAEVITREEYALFSEGYARRIEEARDAVRELERRRGEVAGQVGRAERALDELARRGGIAELDRRGVVELVERIDVHADKSVDVRFRVERPLKAAGIAVREEGVA